MESSINNTRQTLGGLKCPSTKRPSSASLHQRYAHESAVLCGVLKNSPESGFSVLECCTALPPASAPATTAGETFLASSFSLARGDNFRLTLWYEGPSQPSPHKSTEWHHKSRPYGRLITPGLRLRVPVERVERRCAQPRAQADAALALRP